MGASRTSQKYEGVRSKELNSGDIAYYVRWSDSSGKRFERKVGTKASGWSEKRAHLKRIELINAPTTIRENLTIPHIIERYLAIQKLHLAPRSYANCKSECLGHIMPFFQNRIDTISQRQINDFILTLKATLAPKTINSLVERVGHIIKWAIKEYNLSLQNPTSGIKKLKIDNARERFLSKDEVDRLLSIARAHKNKEVYYFFVLAFSTGARFESVRNITIGDMDFSQGTIKMRDFKTNSKYSAFLTPLAVATFKDYGENTIFKTPKATLSKALQKILNELFNKELDSCDRKNKAVIHTTRHTFASHLAIKGTPIHIIQKLLNHKDIKMTMRYAHLLPSSGKEWVEGLWS